MRVKHLIELLQKEVEKDPSVAELRLVAEFDCYGSGTRKDEVEDIKLVKLGFNKDKRKYEWEKPSDTKFIYLDIWPLHTDGSIPEHIYA